MQSATPNILAAGRGAESRAERLLNSEDLLHVCTLCASIAGVLLGEPWVYACGVLGLVTEALSLWVRREAARIRGLGREAMRCATLVSAQLIQESSEPVRRVLASLPEESKVEEAAVRWYANWSADLPQGRPWWRKYWATEAIDPADRLGDMMLESAMWWEHLAARSRRRSLFRVIGVVAAVAIAVIASRLLRAPLELAEIVIQIGFFVLAADVTVALVRWSSVHTHAHDLAKSIAESPRSDLGQALLWFTDYCSMTSLAPPVPSSILDQATWQELTRRGDDAVRLRSTARSAPLATGQPGAPAAPTALP